MSFNTHILFVFNHVCVKIDLVQYLYSRHMSIAQQQTHDQPSLIQPLIQSLTHKVIDIIDSGMVIQALQICAANPKFVYGLYASVVLVKAICTGYNMYTKKLDISLEIKNLDLRINPLYIESQRLDIESQILDIESKRLDLEILRLKSQPAVRDGSHKSKK